MILRRLAYFLNLLASQPSRGTARNAWTRSQLLAQRDEDNRPDPRTNSLIDDFDLDYHFYDNRPSIWQILTARHS